MLLPFFLNLEEAGQTVTVGLGSEADSGLAATPLKRFLVEIAGETSTSLQPVALKTRPSGQASEAYAVFGVSTGKARSRELLQLRRHV